MVPAGAQALKYRGQVVADTATPASLELVDNCLLHVVRSVVDLDEVYGARNMFFHCKNCSNAACKYTLRPICSTCG